MWYPYMDEQVNEISRRDYISDYAYVEQFGE
jgi:hypothetical protein